MPAVLLDRDGVINENREDYVTRWEDFRFLPRSLEALAELRNLGFRLAVVTNQSAIGRGLLTRETMDDIHLRMMARCASSGVDIEDVFVCPHTPWDRCACRKPRPGLLLQAMAALGERPEQCVAIGDSEGDMRAAGAAGVPFVLVRTGRGERTLQSLDGSRPQNLLVADDLWEAHLALPLDFDARAAPKAA